MTYCGNNGQRFYFDCLIAVLDPKGVCEVGEPIVLTQAGTGVKAKDVATRGARQYMAEQFRRLGLQFELIAVVPAGDSFALASALERWRAAGELIDLVDG